MSKSRLLQAALTGTLALAALPAHAEAIHDADRWGNALDRAGINVVLSDHCPPNLLASYTPSRRAITLCRGRYDSNAELYDAIAHESVHAIQHCAARRLGSTALLPIANLIAQDNPKLAGEFLLATTEVSASKTYQMQASTRFNGRAFALQLEREAYALETAHDTVISMLGICH